MALADYRLCDICGQKAFYDSSLGYDFDEYPVTGLWNLGDWSVLCRDCSKTHRTLIEEIKEEKSIYSEVAMLKRLRDYMDSLAPPIAKRYLGEAIAIIEQQSRTATVSDTSNKAAWQPIETAPMDGTNVLLIATRHSMLMPHPEMIVGAYRSGWWSGPSTLSHVTHWMPLPEAPAPKTDLGG